MESDARGVIVDMLLGRMGDAAPSLFTFLFHVRHEVLTETLEVLRGWDSVGRRSRS
jgi:hypothetical protein